jgi:2-polyprenyl-3-methyl-5-hydroxy-6-metoxy-1,4-benzoquinol methylase
MKNKNSFSQYGFFKDCCRLCKSKSLFKFLDLGYHPPSDEFKKKNQLNNPTLYFPLEVCSCNKCGFKQLNFVVNPSYLYQNDYPYESSLTQAGQTHYNKFAENVISKFNLSKKDLVLDIGSNIGTLLQGFKKNKIKVLGIDPAKNICEIANIKGIETYNGFFDRRFVNFLRKKKQKAKIITATNVFAHIENLDAFLRNIKNIINPKNGVLIIESPHFLHLVKDLEYDTIYHEHLSYILVKPLITFLKKHNFQIFDVIKKDIHGGSIRIFISKINSFKIHNNVKKICKEEVRMKLYSNKNLIEFSNNVRINRYNLISFLTKLKLKKKRIIAVSAPAKGMTLLNFAKIDMNYIDFATDKSYLKINRYSPGGNIPVLKDSDISKHNPDYALLLAWNFSKEIIRNNISFLKKGGKFIIPIPKLKIIDYKNYK